MPPFPTAATILLPSAAMAMALHETAGAALDIHADTQFVVETHYLNATDRTLLARDVLRVHRVADVAMWVSSMALETLDISVQPGEATLAFDCTAPHDLDVLQYWGHMHGLGDA